jgi:hypothetical protein
MSSHISTTADLDFLQRAVSDPRIAASITALVIGLGVELDAEDERLLDILSRVQLHVLEVRRPWTSDLHESRHVEAIANTQAGSLRKLVWNTQGGVSLSSWLRLSKLESFELCGCYDIFDCDVGATVSQLRVNSLALGGPLEGLILNPWLEKFATKDSYIYSDSRWFADAPRFNLRVLDLAGAIGTTTFHLLPELVSRCPDLEELTFMDYAGLDASRRVLETVQASCRTFQKLGLHSCWDEDRVPTLRACETFRGLSWYSGTVELHGCLVESLCELTNELEQVGEVVLMDCLVESDRQRVSLRLKKQ